MASAVANCLSKISFWKMGKCFNNETRTFCNRLEKMENFFFQIFRILLWDDPYLTSFCIFCLNIFFGLIIYLDLKFYGIIFIAILLLTFEQIWVEQIFQIFISKKSETEMQNLSEQNSPKNRGDAVANSLSNIYFRRSQEILKAFFERAKCLRKSQPGMFCAVTCVFFLFLSVIGRSISGIASLYLMFMFAFIVPGIIIHFLPPHVVSSLSNFIYSDSKEENMKTDEIESFLPNTNQEALEVLRLAGESQFSIKDDEENPTDLLLERISTHTSDSESLSSKYSFYPESSFMPSPENSIDFFELDLPSSDHPTEKSEFEDLDNNEISFQSKHFNGESSDEDEFTKGLKLIASEDNITTEANDQVTSAENLNVEGPIALPITKTTTFGEEKGEKKSEKETSSDTDSFEMVSEEDV